MDATTSGLVWVAKSSGKARWYETACGRFSLSRGGKRGTWELFDRQAKSVVTPEFNRCETVYSVASGKAKAARWLAGKQW